MSRQRVGGQLLRAAVVSGALLTCSGVAAGSAHASGAPSIKAGICKGPIGPPPRGGTEQQACDGGTIPTSADSVSVCCASCGGQLDPAVPGLGEGDQPGDERLRKDRGERSGAHLGGYRRRYFKLSIDGGPLPREIVIDVVNPGGDGGVSNPVTLDLTNPTPIPVRARPSGARRYDEVPEGSSCPSTGQASHVPPTSAGTAKTVPPLRSHTRVR